MSLQSMTTSKRNCAGTRAMAKSYTCAAGLAVVVHWVAANMHIERRLTRGRLYEESFPGEEVAQCIAEVLPTCVSIRTGSAKCNARSDIDEQHGYGSSSSTAHTTDLEYLSHTIDNAGDNFACSSVT
jgi:hypothetical protein